MQSLVQAGSWRPANPAAGEPPTCLTLTAVLRPQGLAKEGSSQGRGERGKNDDAVLKSASESRTLQLPMGT